MEVVLIFPDPIMFSCPLAFSINLNTVTLREDI